ncbi:hypothetical protein HKX48_002802 [Thoreauomyces humboldtii]|nr:hypothetical protein HKX48_002802 [Thoreauomyces humboldtii]
MDYIHAAQHHISALLIIEVPSCPGNDMLADAELSPLPPPGLPVKLTDLPPKILQTIATMSQEFPDTHLYPELSVIGRLRQTCWKLRVKIPLSVPVDVVRRFRIGCLTHSDSVLRGKHDDDPLQQEYMSQRQKGAFPCYCRVGRRKADRAYAELEEQRRRLISDSAQDDDDRARSIVAGVPPPRGLSPACPQHLDATDYYNNLVIRALKTGSTLVFQSFHKIDAWRALSEDNPYFTRFIMETAVESRNLDFVQVFGAIIVKLASEIYSTAYE